MPRYLYECPVCHERRSLVLRLEERNDPQFCVHEEGEQRLEVLMIRPILPFRFTACLERDRPENQLYRVITKSNDPQDWLRAERADADRAEREAAELPDVPTKLTEWSDVDIQGAWTAAHAGPEQLERWRSDNIGPDPLESDRPEVEVPCEAL